VAIIFIRFSIFFRDILTPDHSQHLHHPVHGLAHGTQPLFILGRAFGQPVLRPEGPTQVGTERTAADRNHLADDIEVVDGLQGYLLAAHTVAAHCQDRTHFVAQDVGVLSHHGTAAVQHGLGLGAQVALVHGGADDDAVRPFQAVVEVGHVVLVDAAAALTDAIVFLNYQKNIPILYKHSIQINKYILLKFWTPPINSGGIIISIDRFITLLPY